MNRDNDNASPAQPAPLPAGATCITTDNAPTPTNDDLDAQVFADMDRLGQRQDWWRQPGSH